MAEGALLGTEKEMKEINFYYDDDCSLAQAIAIFTLSNFNCHRKTTIIVPQHRTDWSRRSVVGMDRYIMLSGFYTTISFHLCRPNCVCGFSQKPESFHSVSLSLSASIFTFYLIRTWSVLRRQKIYASIFDFNTSIWFEVKILGIITAQ